MLTVTTTTVPEVNELRRGKLEILSSTAIIDGNCYRYPQQQDKQDKQDEIIMLLYKLIQLLTELKEKK